LIASYSFKTDADHEIQIQSAIWVGFGSLECSSYLLLSQFVNREFIDLSLQIQVDCVDLTEEFSKENIQNYEYLSALTQSTLFTFIYSHINRRSNAAFFHITYDRAQD
jgi:hypothetical protein